MKTNLGIDMNNSVNKYNSERSAIEDEYKMKQQDLDTQLKLRNQRMQELGFYYQYDPQ
jgi:hypothetical protein